MPDSPRFSEDDINAIFQEAIRAQEESRGRDGRRDGLTLEELQEIGAELGISAEFISRAAAARKTPIAAKPDQKIIGIPVSVERVVELPRALSDEEWGRIVADLRQTFDAQGRVSEQGTLRQWTNGNLSAMLEPSGDGWRLRLRTLKGSAAPRFTASGALAIFSMLLTTLLAVKNLPQDPSKYLFAGFFMLAALIMSGYTAVSTSRWHRLRSEQMDALAKRVSAMVAEDSLTTVEAVAAKTRETADGQGWEAAGGRIDLPDENIPSEDDAVRRGRDRG